jgi:hypothetical protein
LDPENDIWFDDLTSIQALQWVSEPGKRNCQRSYSYSELVATSMGSVLLFIKPPNPNEYDFGYELPRKSYPFRRQEIKKGLKTSLFQCPL